MYNYYSDLKRKKELEMKKKEEEEQKKLLKIRESKKYFLYFGV